MATNTKTKKKKTTEKKKKAAIKSTAKKRKSNMPAKAADKKKMRLIGTAASAVAVVLALIIAFAVTYTPKHPVYQFDKPIANGIDVSSHNGKIVWSEAKNEIDFAFVRAGYRGYENATLVADKRARKNLKSARRAGVPVGVYFFSQAITEDEAVEEAEFTLSVIKGCKIDLPIAIDFEHAYDNGELGGRLYNANLTKKEASKIINAFCKTIRNAGYTPAVYASTYFYTSIIDPSVLSRDTVIWIADYNDEITYKGKFDIWQYSKTGHCAGVDSKYVDMDYWYN